MTTKAFKPQPVECETHKDIKSVRDCCVYPYHGHREIELRCYNESRVNHYNTSGSALFAQEVAVCYLDRTNLLNSKNPDAKFDKEKAKEIYRHFTAIYKVHLGTDPWFDVIGKAVDKCDFVFGPNLRKSIDNFYNCTNEYLLTHCAIIDPSDLCSPTQEAFEKCKNFEEYCMRWPVEIMMPEFCCNYPQLISQKLQNDYRVLCSEKTSSREAAMCVKGLMDKKFKPTGTYDFGEVLATLSGNVNSSVGRLWDASIEKSVQTCKTFIEGNKFKFFTVSSAKTLSLLELRQSLCWSPR